MLDAILISSRTGQRLVATESIPDGWKPPKTCKVIRFNEKRNLLRAAEFRESLLAVGPMVKAMREALAASDPREAVESSPSVPAHLEDDDEE